MADSYITVLEPQQARALLKHTNRIMGLIRARSKSMVRLNEGDQLRLIRWISWNRRFGVPLTYVVDKAFEWAEQVSSVKIKARRRKYVFPLSVAAMTGEMCLKYVQESVATDYAGVRPNREALRNKMLQDTAQAPEHSEGTILSFDTLQAYALDYSKHAVARRKAMESAEVTLRTSKPFRGNPFR